MADVFVLDEQGGEPTGEDWMRRHRRMRAPETIEGAGVAFDDFNATPIRSSALTVIPMRVVEIDENGNAVSDEQVGPLPAARQ